MRTCNQIVNHTPVSPGPACWMDHLIKTRARPPVFASKGGLKQKFRIWWGVLVIRFAVDQPLSVVFAVAKFLMTSRSWRSCFWSNWPTPDWLHHQHHRQEALSKMLGPWRRGFHVPAAQLCLQVAGRQKCLHCHGLLFACA